MHEMQDYIDAQYGGPGKGWYRIVTQPVAGPQGHQRRASWRWSWASRPACPFGCTFKGCPAATCPPATRRRSTRQLDEVHGMGVRQMELVNKFDNALSGVAGDDGEVGVGRQHRQLPRDRLLLGHASTASPQTPERPRPQPGRRAGHQRRASRTRCSARSPSCFGAVGLPALPLYPRARPLQRAAA